MNSLVSYTTSSSEGEEDEEGAAEGFNRSASCGAGGGRLATPPGPSYAAEMEGAALLEPEEMWEGVHPSIGKPPSPPQVQEAAEVVDPPLAPCAVDNVGLVDPTAVSSAERETADLEPMEVGLDGGGHTRGASFGIQGQHTYHDPNGMKALQETRSQCEYTEPGRGTMEHGYTSTGLKYPEGTTVQEGGYAHSASGAEVGYQETEGQNFENEGVEEGYSESVAGPSAYQGGYLEPTADFTQTGAAVLPSAATSDDGNFVAHGTEDFKHGRGEVLQSGVSEGVGKIEQARGYSSDGTREVGRQGFSSESKRGTGKITDSSEAQMDVDSSNQQLPYAAIDEVATANRIQEYLVEEEVYPDQSMHELERELNIKWWPAESGQIKEQRTSVQAEAVSVTGHNYSAAPQDEKQLPPDAREQVPPSPGEQPPQPPPGPEEQPQPGVGEQLPPGPGEQFQPGPGEQFQPGPGEQFQPGPGEQLPPGPGKQFQPGPGEQFQPGLPPQPPPGPGEQFQPGPGEQLPPQPPPGPGEQLQPSPRKQLPPQPPPRLREQPPQLPPGLGEQSQPGLGDQLPPGPGEQPPEPPPSAGEQLQPSPGDQLPPGPGEQLQPGPGEQPPQPPPGPREQLPPGLDTPQEVDPPAVNQVASPLNPLSGQPVQSNVIGEEGRHTASSQLIGKEVPMSHPTPTNEYLPTAASRPPGMTADSAEHKANEAALADEVTPHPPKDPQEATVTPHPPGSSTGDEGATANPQGHYSQTSEETDKNGADADYYASGQYYAAAYQDSDYYKQYGGQDQQQYTGTEEYTITEGGQEQQYTGTQYSENQQQQQLYPEAGTQEQQYYEGQYQESQQYTEPSQDQQQIAEGQGYGDQQQYEYYANYAEGQQYYEGQEYDPQAYIYSSDQQYQYSQDGQAYTAEGQQLQYAQDSEQDQQQQQYATTSEQQQYSQDPNNPQYPQDPNSNQPEQSQYAQDPNQPSYTHDQSQPQVSEQSHQPPQDTNQPQYPRDLSQPQQAQISSQPQPLQDPNQPQYPRDLSQPQPPQDPNQPQYPQDLSQPQQAPTLNQPQSLMAAQDPSQPQYPQDLSQPSYSQDQLQYPAQGPSQIQQPQESQDSGQPQPPQDSSQPQYPQVMSELQQPQPSPDLNQPQYPQVPNQPQSLTQSLYPPDLSQPQYPQDPSQPPYPPQAPNQPPPPQIQDLSQPQNPDYQTQHAPQDSSHHPPQQYPQYPRDPQDPNQQAQYQPQPQEANYTDPRYQYSSDSYQSRYAADTTQPQYPASQNYPPDADHMSQPTYPQQSRSDHSYFHGNYQRRPLRDGRHYAHEQRGDKSSGRGYSSSRTQRGYSDKYDSCRQSPYEYQDPRLAGAGGRDAWREHKEHRDHQYRGRYDSHGYHSRSNYRDSPSTRDRDSSSQSSSGSGSGRSRFDDGRSSADPRVRRNESRSSPTVNVDSRTKKEQSSSSSDSSTSSKHYTKSAKYAAISSNFVQRTTPLLKQSTSSRKSKDSKKGPQLIQPHSAPEPLGKKKKPEKAKPVSFPGEASGSKKSLSSFKIPKRKSATTTTTESAPPVKIPALDISEHKEKSTTEVVGGVGDAKAKTESVVVAEKRPEATKDASKSVQTPPTTVAPAAASSPVKSSGVNTTLFSLKATTQGGLVLVPAVTSSAATSSSTTTPVPILPKPTSSASSLATLKTSQQPSEKSPAVTQVSTSDIRNQALSNSKIAALLASKPPTAATTAATKPASKATAATAKSKRGKDLQAVKKSSSPAPVLSSMLATKKSPSPAPSTVAAIKPADLSSLLVARKSPSPAPPTRNDLSSMLQTLNPSILQTLAATIQKTLEVADKKKAIPLATSLTLTTTTTTSTATSTPGAVSTPSSYLTATSSGVSSAAPTATTLTASSSTVVSSATGTALAAISSDLAQRKISITPIPMKLPTSASDSKQPGTTLKLHGQNAGLVLATVVPPGADIKSSTAATPKLLPSAMSRSASERVRGKEGISMQKPAPSEKMDVEGPKTDHGSEAGLKSGDVGLKEGKMQTASSAEGIIATKSEATPTSTSSTLIKPSPAVASLLVSPAESFGSQDDDKSAVFVDADFHVLYKEYNLRRSRTMLTTIPPAKGVSKNASAGSAGSSSEQVTKAEKREGSFEESSKAKRFKADVGALQLDKDKEVLPQESEAKSSSPVKTSPPKRGRKPSLSQSKKLHRKKQAAGSKENQSDVTCCLCMRKDSANNLGFLYGPYKPVSEDKPADQQPTVPTEGVADQLPVWVHEDCAVWAPGVCLVRGKLLGLHEAVADGKSLSCRACKSPGATLCCSARACKAVYHFPCARDAGCSFKQEQFIITCPKHKPPS